MRQRNRGISVVKKIIFGLTTLFFQIEAHGARIQVHAASVKYKNTTLSQSIVLTKEADLKNVPLTLKPVAFAVRNSSRKTDIPLYLIELHAENPEKIDRKLGFTSVLQNLPVALHLHYYGDADSKSIAKGLEESFKKNDVATTAPGIPQFINALKQASDVKTGDTVVIFALKPDTVYYQRNNKAAVKVKGDANLAKNILSVWLGTPVDDQIQAMQKTLFN